GATEGITASSSDTLTNKSINIQAGQGNTLQIQGNSISSYSGSGSVVLLQNMPTLNAFNIGNGSNLTVDGGSGSYYWSGPTGVAQAGIDKAGVYRSSSSATNSLFTFAANGAGTMSAAIEGSLFIGTAMPSNNGGLNTDYPGWLVVQSGGKFGGDLNTRGALIFDDSATGAVVFADGSRQTTAWDTGYLSFDDAALRGTSGYQYTFNTDGYFSGSTSSESPNYFFVTYNSTNLNIAAGWTVVGANCNTTVSSTVYPVGGYPGVIKVNLTAAASSTSGFYPVVVTSPDRLKVQIQPNPGTASKYTFTTAGLTFPDATVQTTAYTGPQTSLDGDITGSVFADDSTLLVDGVNGIVPNSELSKSVTQVIDSDATINTSKNVTTNNAYTNPTNFVADIDPSLGFVIPGMSQRNSTEIEVNLFVEGFGALYTYLTALTTGRTVIATYSTASGNQTFTSTISQVFSAAGGQVDPITGWYRVAGRILGTVPAGYTGLVGINFPVYSVDSHTWQFGDDGDLTFPDNTVQSTAWTGIAGVARNIESESDVSIRVNLTDSTTRVWQFSEGGDLTFPEGGVIAEGIVTSNPTIELTPAGPQIESQRLIIKG
ncbi:MAG: hypothetical protein EBU08_17080, partial [Micrococcales bacterium]|nr:hypothetical protein [Micrococcales bacterium]